MIGPKLGGAGGGQFIDTMPNLRPIFGPNVAPNFAPKFGSQMPKKMPAILGKDWTDIRAICVIRPKVGGWAGWGNLWTSCPICAQYSARTLPELCPEIRISDAQKMPAILGKDWTDIRVICVYQAKSGGWAGWAIYGLRPIFGPNVALNFAPKFG